MLLDSTLAFDGPDFVAVTTTRDSTNVLDMLNARDMGIGTNLYLAITTNGLFAAAGAGTLTIQVSGSADNSSYTVYAQSIAFSIAQLNVRSLLFPIVLPRPPAGSVALPRYYKLVYTVATGPFTAGALMAYLSPWRDDMVYYPSGFSTADIA